jgi:hypothetical protein
LVLVVLALAARSEAQEPQTPPDSAVPADPNAPERPSPDRPLAEPTPAPAPAGGPFVNGPDGITVGTPSPRIDRRPLRWTFSLGARELWERNPALVPDNDEDFYATGGFASLGYAHTGPRGSFGFNASGSIVGWSESPELNQGNWGGGMSGSRKLSAHTTADFVASFYSTDTHQQAGLVNQGLILPYATSRSVVGGAGLVRELSARSSLSLRGEYDRFSFDDPLLADGYTGTGTATYTHRFGRATSMSLAYSYQYSGSGVGIDTPFQYATAGVAFPLGRKTSVSLTGGAVFYTVAGDGTATWQGTARITGRYRRSSWDVEYGRSMGVAYGFARQRILDLASAGWNRALGRRASLRAGYVYSKSTAIAGESLTFETHDAVGSLHLDLGRKVALTGTYSYRHAENDASGMTGGISLSYGAQWR